MLSVRVYIKKHSKEFFLVSLAAIVQSAVFIANIFWGLEGFMWLSDSPGYLEIAKNVLTSKCFCLQPEWGPQSFRTPLYSLFIALFYWLTNSLWFVIFIQNIVAVINILLTYKLGKIIFGSKVGFLGALLLIFESARLVLANQLMTETLFVFFVLVAVYFFIRYIQEDEITYLIISAIGIGLAALTRPVVQFFFLGVILFFLVYGIARKNFKKCFLSAFLFLTFFAVTVSPWLVRNYVHFDKLGLSGIGGYGFYATHGNIFLEYWLGLNRTNDGADVVGFLNRNFYNHFDLNLWTDDSPGSYLMSGQVMGYPYDEYLFKEGLKIISLDPALYAWLHVRRAATFFVESSASRSYGALLYGLDLPSSIFYPYLYFGGRALRILYNLIILASLIFFFRTFKKKIWEKLFLVGTILYFVPLSSMATDVGRYRQPVEPFFFLFLGNAIILFYYKFKNKVYKSKPEYENKEVSSLNENRNCVLCGSDEVKLLNKYGILEKGGPVIKFNNFICKNCGLVFLNPQPTLDNYNKIYKKYENSRHLCQDKKSIIKLMDTSPNEAKAREIYNFLNDYVDSQKKILDIGCGFGQVSNNFKNKFNLNVKAVEASDLLSEIINNKFGVSCFCGNFDKFFENNTERFDVLVMHHVFEHFTDPKEKLAQFRKILNPGGVIYMEIPNIVSFKKPVNHFFDYMHPFSYSPKIFKELVYKNHFKIIKVNKDKKYRLQLLIAPNDSDYHDIGKDEYWDFGKYQDINFFIKKRKLADFLRQAKNKIYGH